MFKNFPRSIALASVMLVFVFCIFCALGLRPADTADGVSVFLKWSAIFAFAVVGLIWPFAKNDDLRRPLKRLAAICIVIGFLALVIWPNELNPAESLPYLIVGAMVVSIIVTVVLPTSDLPLTLDGLFIACVGGALVSAVLVWKICLGPLWDVSPVVGGLAGLSVSITALGLVFLVQKFAPEFPVKQLVV